MRYVAVLGVPSLFTSTPTSVAYWLNPFGPATRTSLPSRSDTSTASLSEYVTVNMYVLEPVPVTSVATRSADGAATSGTFTVNAPSAPAAARFPDASLTCPAWSETVYVPLSARPHSPPGAVMR